MAQIAWFTAQIGAIAYMTWVMSGQAEAAPAPLAPGQVVVAFAMAVLITAFGTACLTRLWDWTHRQLQGLPFRTGRSVARGLRAGRDLRQAIEQRDGRRARLRGRELRQPPTALR